MMIWWWFAKQQTCFEEIFSFESHSPLTVFPPWKYSWANTHGKFLQQRTQLVTQAFFSLPLHQISDGHKKWDVTRSIKHICKVMEGNVFSHVCLSVSQSFHGGCSHMTITHDALDLTGQGPPPPVTQTWDLTAQDTSVGLSAISNSFEILVMFSTIHSFSGMNEWLINNKSMDSPIDTLTCSYVLNTLETHGWHSQVTDLCAIINSG